MKKYLALAVAATGFLAPHAASAQVDCTTGTPCITTFDVFAEVVANCSALNATDIDFGVDGAINVEDDAEGSIEVTCVSGASYDIELDYGVLPNGTIRQVTTGGSGTPGIDYYLYQDAGRTVAWGEEANGEEFQGTGTGAAQTIPVYGRLDRNDANEVGTYTDLITVTLNF